MVDIEQFVCHSIADVLGVPRGEVNGDYLIDNPLWDSLSAIAIVAQIEANFGVQVSTDDAIALSSASSVKEIALSVKKIVGADVRNDAHVTRARALRAQHTVRHKREECRQLFYMYRGRAGRVTAAPSRFLRQTEIHKRNFVLFDDVRGEDYTRGISADIPTFEKFLEWQRLQQVEHFAHVDELYGIGTSSGALAAILSGHFLKLRIVWSFALSATWLRRLEQPHFDVTLGQVHLNCNLPRGTVDLSDVLATHNGTTEYRLFYNENYQPDRVAAERLSMCPGVSLFPQSGRGHFVLTSMAMQGKLTGVLEPFRSVVQG